jgi:DNA-binding Lrp family transcriptional regulator
MLDEIDLEIIHIFSLDCRSSYRRIGSRVGLSTNAVKARVKKLISMGVIQEFLTTVNPTVLGYSSICYLVVKNYGNLDDIRTRIRLAGQLVLEIDCVGGISIFGIALKKDQENKIPLLTEALKPAIADKITVGQLPIREKLRQTDLLIIKCLLSNPRMEISKIADKISRSSKTVGARLDKMKEFHILGFIAIIDPLKMKGFIKFGMIIHIKESSPQPNVARQIVEKLEEKLMISPPIVQQDDVVICQATAKNIFEIDPLVERIKSIDSIKSSEILIPSRIKIDKDWILNELNRLVPS